MSPATLKKPAWSPTNSGSSRDRTYARVRWRSYRVQVLGSLPHARGWLRVEGCFKYHPWYVLWLYSGKALT